MNRYMLACAAAAVALTAQAQSFLDVKTESGESPVKLESMTLDVNVKGLFATVETELVFRNPNRRIMEGNLRFPLTDGAAVNGYAIDVNGAMVDGVIVKKEKARVVFEAETRRRVDPGIVEHVKGNLYNTRIYPLPARGKRTVRISYVTPLTVDNNGDAALRLAMPGETIGKRKITISVDAGEGVAPEVGGLGDRRMEKADMIWRVSAEETDVTPQGDVLVALPKLPAQLSGVEIDSDGQAWFYASAIAPDARAERKTPNAPLHIIWDASGSRDTSELSLDYAFIEALPDMGGITLTVFRDKPEAPRKFANAAKLVEHLKTIAYDGGTDFAELAAALPDEGGTRLLFSDGMDTLSGKPMSFRGAKPTAVVSALVADHEGLRQACGGAVLDLQSMAISNAVANIINPPPYVSGITGTGIAEMHGIGVPAHGRVTVIGRLVAPETEIKIAYGGVAESPPFHLAAAKARQGKTLSSAWAAQAVARLSPSADANADELLALGRKYGVVSPATSLIVLESLDQWVRHGIEPPESLPQMRERWRDMQKANANRTVDSTAQHLAMLENLWKDRLEWLKRDFSKQPVTKRPPEEESGPGGDMAEAMMEMEAPGAPPPSEIASPARTRISYSGGAVAQSMKRKQAAAADAKPSFSISIKPWDPKKPYIDAISKADGGEAMYAAYMAQKQTNGTAPSFYLDCADFFLKRGDLEIGIRILTNLAEMKVEDAALLRVLAWRLRDAGQYGIAIPQLRRIVKLRGEDPQSYRDLAIALSEQGKELRSAEMLEEAFALYIKVAFTPWARHAGTISIFALEELNALIAWAEAANWDGAKKPAMPEFDEKFRASISTDLRIVISWDADATDVDLHVVEPSGEEAYYSNNRTAAGGLVSHDVTDGYGPEEYMIAKAPGGEYAIFANYYSSSQQTMLGPATVTATVYTDWGRTNEVRQALSIRLDKPKDKVEIGRVKAGGGMAQLRQGSAKLEADMEIKAVDEMLGDPKSISGDVREYAFGESTIKATFNAAGKLVRAERHFPGGMIMLLVQ